MRWQFALGTGWSRGEKPSPQTGGESREASQSVNHPGDSRNREAMPAGRLIAQLLLVSATGGSHSYLIIKHTTTPSENIAPLSSVGREEVTSLGVSIFPLRRGLW